MARFILFGLAHGIVPCNSDHGNCNKDDEISKSTKKNYKIYIINKYL